MLILLLCNSYSFAEIVNKIEIIGNERVNSETIKIFGEVAINDDLNSDDLNNVLKKLYETNFFENVNLSLNNSILRITVVENAIVQNLIIKGIDNNNLKEKISDTITIKEKNPYLENKVKNDLNNVRNLLQEVGFYFSSVDILKKDNSNNTIDLIFEIDLGDKAFINEIVFLGDKKFKKRKLLNIITSEENKFWKFISNKKLLNKQRIELDKRLLVSFYKNQGYYNVSILDEAIQFDDEQNFKIIFNIDSGKKFYFGNFSIDLPDDFEKSYFEKIAKKLNKFSGEKYSFKVIEKMLTQIEKIANNKQYEFVNADIDEKLIDDKIDITIKLLNDEPNIYVKKINIFGNNVTIEDVIRNEFIIDEGDPFNKILFQKSINNIKSTNIFKSVDAKLVDTDNELEKTIDITVEEKPTGQISAGAGVGTSGASTSFGIQENNFLGKGIILDSNLSLSEETIKGLFSYTKPKFKNTDRDLILTVESQETDRLESFGYKTAESGFLIGTRFEQLEDFYIKPQFSIYYETLDTASTASSLLKKQEGDYLDALFSYSLQLDRRDQSYQPTDGYLSTFYQSLPLNIEDNQTVVNSYEIKNYYEYFDDLVASISIFSKAANSLGEDDARLSDTLYLPPSKLRGLQSGKVGPTEG